MKRMRNCIASLSVVLLFAFVFTGCATIFKGSTDTVNVTSKPAGSEVYINGMFFGNTPLQLELKSNKTYVVEFRMDGYLSQTVMLNSSIAVGYLILDVLFGIIPVVVDAATGNWMSLDMNVVGAALQPSGK